MPIKVVDESEELDLDKADGKTLRRKLEEALEANKSLTQLVATSKAAQVIESMGTKLVKPEDLSGVSLDEIEAKAKELHEQRMALRSDAVRDVLAERGLEGEDLEAAVEEFLGGDDVPSEEEPKPKLTGMEGLGGDRPGRKADVPLSDPFGNLESHFAEAEKRSRR